MSPNSCLIKDAETSQDSDDALESCSLNVLLIRRIHVSDSNATRELVDILKKATENQTETSCSARL